MKKLLLVCSFLSVSIFVFAQNNPKSVVGKLGANPIYIIDSQKVDHSEILKYKATSIATVIILTDTSTTRLYGDSAKDGIVIIETRTYARGKFISFFRKSSKTFDSLYTAVGSDVSFAYIINGKIQKENYEGTLSAITDDVFEGLEVLDKKQLYSKYNISDKEFGILIRSKKPKDLYDPEKKFDSTPKW